MEPVDHVTRVGPGAQPEPQVPYLDGWRWCPVAGQPAEWEEDQAHGCHWCPDDMLATADQHLRLVPTSPTAAQGGTADDPVWSNWVVDGELQTWRQLFYREAGQRRALERWATLVADLDRCEHGRHEGDVCGGARGCNGPSLGNPLLDQGQVPRALQRLLRRFQPDLPPAGLLGFGMAAQPIVLPARADRHRPETWYR